MKLARAIAACEGVGMVPNEQVGPGPGTLGFGTCPVCGARWTGVGADLLVGDHVPLWDSTLVPTAYGGTPRRLAPHQTLAIAAFDRLVTRRTMVTAVGSRLIGGVAASLESVA